MNTYSDLTEHPLDEQHGMAYEVYGSLTAQGFKPTLEIGGGGILEVIVPLVVPSGKRHRIRFASYVEDSLFCEQQFDDGEWEHVWYLPSKLFTPDIRPWIHVENFVNELKKELGTE